MIPAIDVMRGRAVILVGGRPATAQVVSDDPVALARDWQRRGAKRLHLVDLDAALSSGENRELVRDVLRALAIPVQIGGGLRDEAALRDLLSHGATKAIVGTRAIRDPAWLRDMAVRFPSRLVLALDRDERGVLVEGWRHASNADPADLIERANRLPLDGVLFTNVAREGRLQGVGDANEPIVRRCAKPRIASGGVASLEDVRALRRAGFDHVVVGRALYTGHVDFDRAEEAMR
ncbi:MAG: HisA/HisF-related TIM barrel protein [Methanobacteriota archaeon]